MDRSSLEMDPLLRYFVNPRRFRYDLAFFMAGSARKRTHLLKCWLVLADVDTAWNFLWLGQMVPMQILHGIAFESFPRKGKKRPKPCFGVEAFSSILRGSLDTSQIARIAMSKMKTRLKTIARLLGLRRIP